MDRHPITFVPVNNVKIDPTFIPEGEIPKNIDDFTCKICSFILYEPYECENCGTPYCKDCIELWHQKSGNCPIKCGGTLKIKPAHRFIKKMVNEIKVNCLHKDCPFVSPYEKIYSHLDICDYKIVDCSNEGCKEKFLKRDISEHLKVCKFKLNICERCGEKLEIKEKCSKNDLEKEEVVQGRKSIESISKEEVFEEKAEMLNIEHDCIKTLTTNIRELRSNMVILEKKSKKYEKDIKELIDKTTVLMCNITYRCDNAHPLVFKPKWTSTCACCGLIKICTRWECLTCNKFYCLDCVKLLNSVFCPNFHTFLFGHRGNYLCDICGAKKTRGGDLSMHDPVCDFDVCDACVVKLFPNLERKNMVAE